MTPPRVAYAAPLLTLAMLVGACSDGDPDAAPTAPGEASSSAGTPSPTTEPSGSPAAEPARLVAERNGTRVPCIEEMRSGDRLSIYDPVLRAEGDLTVVRVEPVTDGTVTLLDEPQVVTVTADPAFGPGIAVGEDWPIGRNAELRDATEWADRGPLAGRAVADGERVLPLLGFRVVDLPRGGSVLEGVDVVYEDAAGTEQTVRAALGTRLAPGRC